MLWMIGWVVTGIYLSLPVLALAMLVLGYPRAPKRKRSIITTFFTGTLLGSGLIFAYAIGIGARASVGQVCLTAYLGVSLILLLKLFDIFLIRLLGKILCVNRSAWRGLLAFVLRLAMFVAIALPWIMSAVMVYRPRVVSADNPQNTLGYPYETVTFNSVDGKKLSGWFIAAQGHASDQTVLICHGLGASKANFMPMAREFVPNGFNVFIFDFRAHGESAGQLTTFGDAEQNDVLGAVQYLKTNKQNATVTIHALGASMGGAALIMAASGEGTLAQQIDTVAILDSYASLQGLTNSVCDYHMLPPMRQLLRLFGLGMCSLHSGHNLSAFAPADHIDQIWPRPVLIIHGVKDVLIPFEHGQALYQHASEPKQFITVEQGDHNNILNDDKVLRKVRLFFENAHAVPVV